MDPGDPVGPGELRPQPEARPPGPSTTAGGGRPDRWAIGLYRGPSPLHLAPAGGVANPVLTAADVTDLAADFVADPFLVRGGGRWSLFFEAMPLGTGPGVIGLAESADGLGWEYRSVVLREPFHLSYPHVFSWRGEYYMTPETLGAREARLYRAARFPDRWEPVGALVTGQHADPTLLRLDETWWLFTCAPPYRHATLRLYYADELTGPWTEHPRSPIVAEDPRSARPAGRVVAWDGALLRFAQDCVPYYGFQVRAFRITRLTREDYREEVASPDPVLAPGRDPWAGGGMHHVDAQRWPGGGWVAAVDGH
jgi:hypothetical protein